MKFGSHVLVMLGGGVAEIVALGVPVGSHVGITTIKFGRAVAMGSPGTSGGNVAVGSGLGMGVTVIHDGKHGFMPPKPAVADGVGVGTTSP